MWREVTEVGREPEPVSPSLSSRPSSVRPYDYVDQRVFQFSLFLSQSALKDLGKAGERKMQKESPQCLQSRMDQRESGMRPETHIVTEISPIPPSLFMHQ